jgi:hypothetical protein
MTQVKLEGVNEVNTALRIAEAKIQEIIVKTVEEVCKAGAFEAKGIITEMGAVDTGALRHSITGDVVKVSPGLVEGQVVAGRTDVRRGEGDFQYSLKTGMLRDVQATSEYAEKIEQTRPFMGSTYVFLKSLLFNKLADSVKSAVKRLGR